MQIAIHLPPSVSAGTIGNVRRVQDAVLLGWGRLSESEQRLVVWIEIRYDGKLTPVSNDRFFVRAGMSARVNGTLVQVHAEFSVDNFNEGVEERVTSQFMLKTQGMLRSLSLRCASDEKVLLQAIA